MGPDQLIGEWVNEKNRTRIEEDKDVVCRETIDNES